MGDPGADGVEFCRVLQEVHHLHQQLLGLVLAAHVGEADLGVLLGEEGGAGVVLAKDHGAVAGGAHLLGGLFKSEGSRVVSSAFSSLARITALLQVRSNRLRTNRALEKVGLK